MIMTMYKVCIETQNLLSALDSCSLDLNDDNAFESTLCVFDMD